MSVKGPVGPSTVITWAGVFHQLFCQPAQVLGIVPVAPVAQADGLLGLHGGVVEHPLLALAHEARQAVVLDVLLGLEAQLALDVDLDPQALAVEAVLVAQLDSRCMVRKRCMTSL